MQMAPNNPDIVPIADAIETTRVQVLTTSVRIRDMLVVRPAVANYLRSIPSDKWEQALLHVIDVGVAEILSRRRAATSKGRDVPPAIPEP